MKSQRKAPVQVSVPTDPKPSEVADFYWLYAERKTGAYPAATENCGKWLVFVPAAQVDEVWARIKLATEEGILGSSAKAATAGPNPNATNPNRRSSVFTPTIGQTRQM